MLRSLAIIILYVSLLLGYVYLPSWLVIIFTGLIGLECLFELHIIPKKNINLHPIGIKNEFGFVLLLSVIVFFFSGIRL